MTPVAATEGFFPTHDPAADRPTCALSPAPSHPDRNAQHVAACDPCRRASAFIFLWTSCCNEFAPRASCAHPGSPEGVFRRQTGRRSGERFLRAGSHPALGRPDRRAGHYEPDAAIDTSLNGSPATGSAPRAVGIRKMPRWSADGRAPYVTGRGTPRHGVLNVPRHGTLRCGDPHQRLSALRPLFGANKKCLKPRQRKRARVGRSVGCLKP
jgi:hypothetical protein